MKLIRTEDAVGSVLCHDMTRGKAKEGKIEIKADADGLFLADRKRLALVNGQDQLMIATRMGSVAVSSILAMEPSYHHKWIYAWVHFL